MAISPVAQGNSTAQAATAAQASTTSRTASSTSSPKSDTAVISQKARDLAALKAGKSFQEEATESIAAKLQEGSGS